MIRTDYDANGQAIAENYEDHLIESLKDPGFAKEYINAALEDEDYRVFLMALRDVADAFGITKLATSAGLNRENIYKMLSTKGNPRISSLIPLLRAIGLRLSTEKTETIASDDSDSFFYQVYEPVGYKVDTESSYTLACPPEKSYHELLFARRAGFWSMPEICGPKFDKHVYVRVGSNLDEERYGCIYGNPVGENIVEFPVPCDPIAAAKQELALAA